MRLVLAASSYANAVLKSRRNSKVKKSCGKPPASSPPSLPSTPTWLHNPSYLCQLTSTIQKGRTKWRSNTLVNFATIGSKTRTRQNATKTLYTYVGILGHVPRFPGIRPRSILLPRLLPILPTALPMMPADIVERNFQIILSWTGTAGPNI